MIFQGTALLQSKPHCCFIQNTSFSVKPQVEFAVIEAPWTVSRSHVGGKQESFVQSFGITRREITTRCIKSVLFSMYTTQEYMSVSFQNNVSLTLNTFF